MSRKEQGRLHGTYTPGGSARCEGLYAHVEGCGAQPTLGKRIME